MSLQELDDILRFGTEELFKDEEAQAQAQAQGLGLDSAGDAGDSAGGGGATGGEETNRIVYDMAAVEKLCDRSQESQVEREEAMNEYLDSFKVATYTVKEGEEVSAPAPAEEGETA